MFSRQPGTHAVEELGKDAFGHTFDDIQDRALELLKRCATLSINLGLCPGSNVLNGA